MKIVFHFMVTSIPQSQLGSCCEIFFKGNPIGGAAEVHAPPLINLQLDGTD